MDEKRTIARLWRDAVAAGRQDPAYLEQRGDEWHPISWPEAAERVEAYANGLLSLGVRKGDAFALLATTRAEWALFDFALGSIGAIGVGIYANSSPKDAGYILDHSESVGILCEDDDQRAKIESVRETIPRLEHVLTFSDLPELAERGRAFAAEHPDALREASEAIEEDDLFTYIYTSGTTGPPKGCMISNLNYYAMVAVVDDLERFTGPGDTMLLYLPLAHNFGRLMHLSGPYVGYTIAFLPDPLKAAAALPAVRPTVFPSVPRVYEKIHTAVVAKFDEATGVRRKLIDWALRVGRDVSSAASRRRARPARAGRAVPRRRPARLREGQGAPRRPAAHGHLRRRPARPGDRRVLPRDRHPPRRGLRADRVHDGGLDEHAETPSGSAPSARRCPASRSSSQRTASCSIKSETVFQGYFKDPEATAEVLGADGWLKTGDIAAIDDDGYITITDRKKDIIVTAGGKNVAPQNLENDLKTSKYVSQAVVVGDRKPYVAALITLEPEEIGKWAAEQGIAGGVEELSRDERVRELIQGVVDEVNAERSRYEQIRRFSILPRDFTMDSGELTPTLKLKRRVVVERFAAELEELYAGETLNAAAGM